MPAVTFLVGSKLRACVYNQSHSSDALNVHRYITEGGNIKPRRFTNVCAKKQRELARSVRRARVMGILARTSKPKFGRDDEASADAVYESEAQ